MTIRRAPKTGYDFGNKRQYRRDIWAQFSRSVPCRADARAALLPSSEGVEIDVALQHGFREQNLHIIDSNAAIVAVHTRRRPLLKPYGVDVVRAFERMRDEGVELECANLDLCGPVSDGLCLLLYDVAKTRVMASESWVAVTYLRGREPNGFIKEIDEDARAFADMPTLRARVRGTERDYGRSHVVGHALEAFDDEPSRDDEICLDDWCEYSSVLVRSASYRSTAGSQTMGWSIFRLHRQPCACNGCIEIFTAGTPLEKKFEIDDPSKVRRSRENFVLFAQYVKHCRDVMRTMERVALKRWGARDAQVRTFQADMLELDDVARRIAREGGPNILVESDPLKV